MNIRARIFGGKTEESPVVSAKKPKGAKSDTLDSIAVRREEARRGNTREADRHRLANETVRVVHNGTAHEVELVNLSGGGAMVAGDFVPMLWDRVDLHLGEGGMIECAVRWIKGGRVGLEFAHETRLDCPAAQRVSLLREVINRSFPDIEVEMPAAEERQPDRVDEEQRAERRHPLIWSGVIHHDYQSNPVRLRNISETGALIECSAPLRVGAEPLLDLGDAGQVAAIVAWVVGDSAGLRFTQPFDLTQLAHARPDVAPAQWNRPGYLDPGEASDSPWGERLSLGELRQELEGFMKR
jgi:hypothetical protein